MPGFKPALSPSSGEQDIQHYTIAEWVDFGRGLPNGTDFDAMRAHAARCESCRKLADYCSKLARVCQDISNAQAPDDVVRRAYAIFSDYGEP